MFNGASLVGLAPYEIARLGVGFVPDERLIFPDLTVRENLEIAERKRARRGDKSIGPWRRSTNCFRCCSRSTRVWAAT